MITTILSTLLPVIVALLLGFVRAWHHDFNSKDATILNRMVLTNPAGAHPNQKEGIRIVAKQ